MCHSFITCKHRCCWSHLHAPVSVVLASHAHRLGVCSHAHVQVFDVLSGRLLNQLQQGHTESINAVAYNPLLCQVYSAANDGTVVTWSPAEDVIPVEAAY